MKIILSANNKTYELNDVDDILDINIDYDKFTAISIEKKENNIFKHYRIMYKSPFDDKFIFENNLDDYNLGNALNDFLDISFYLKKDIDNFNRLKKGE